MHLICVCEWCWGSWELWSGEESGGVFGVWTSLASAEQLVDLAHSSAAKPPRLKPPTMLTDGGKWVVTASFNNGFVCMGREQSFQRKPYVCSLGLSFFFNRLWQHCAHQGHYWDLGTMQHCYKVQSGQETQSEDQTEYKQANSLARFSKPLYLKVKPKVSASDNNPSLHQKIVLVLSVNV